jgi:hypothetical protein
MSQYPINTVKGLYETVNYLASGPSGLGQDFAGFSTYLNGYLTGNYRTPYTYITVVKLAMGSNGANSIQVTNDNSGIQIGQAVTGFGIGTNAVVTSTSVNTALVPPTYTVDLSQPNVNTIPYDAPTATVQVFFAPQYTPQLYVAPIACSSAVQLDDTTFQYNFANVQPYPPFLPGNNITGADFANSYYDGGWTPIGVISCTNANVVVRAQTPAPGTGNDTTGNVYLSSTNVGQSVSTDCNSKVTTVNSTDRVFISSQITNTLNYIGSGDLTYTVFVNRYVGFLTNSDPGNPIYRFNLDQTILQNSVTLPGLSGPGTTAPLQTIFTNAIDNPVPGYYWYIVEVEFTSTGNLEVSQSTLGMRSISTQVVKQ